MGNFGISGAKQVNGIDTSVELKDVKLDKLYTDANKSGKADLTTTQTEITQNYNAGTANTYGGRSSSQTETMDFSTNVDESKTTDTVSTTNINDSSGPTTSGSSQVNDTSQQVNQTNNNSNLNDSSNINNSTKVDSSKASDINSTNQSSNSNMNGNSLSSNNESKAQNDMNIESQDNKTPYNAKKNNATSNQTSSSTNVNMTSNQNANQDNNNSGAGVSFDMPENSFDSSASNNNVEDATKVTITTINSWGQEVTTEIDVDTYRMLLESFGLNDMDIEQVLNGKISQEELFEQIENDEDNTRRVDMLYASYLQAYGLEYNNIADLEQAINDDTNRLNELYKQKLYAENYEIDAIMNFITRLKMGENLDDILNSTVVAWQYTDENGNINYKYEDPYMSGYVDEVTYTPLTFEEMYKDSELLAELRANLTAETIKPLFSKNEKTIYRWTETEAQEQYFYSISDKYGDLVNNRNENLENINSEIKQLEVKVSTYQNICDAIKEEVDYYINNVDSYLHAKDFDANSSFNSEALDTIKALQEANKNKMISPSDYDNMPTIRVTSKEEIVNLISCMLNGEGGNLSNGYLSVDGILFPVTANNDLFSHYLQWLPFVNEEEKLIFNYIYNTEGIDGAYNYLNDVLSSEVDKRWLANKTLEDQEYASEHPILASIGSVLITPFEGIGAMYYSLNSYFTGQKIRRVDVYSSGDIWRTQVASDIAKNSETLSFLYSTGMSMIDSLELIGISVATGGVATPLISAATMGSRAYVSTLNDALDRGLSDGEAVALAFTSSVVETAMESYSVSHLLNLEEKLSENVLKLTNKIASNISNPTIANLVTKSFYVGASALSQGLVEGEEEFTTEILNYVADIFIAKDLSNYTQSLNNYILSGDDENTALIKTMKDFSSQAFQAFLGGFVSGGVFGSFGGTRTTIRASYAIANDMYNKLNGTTKAQQFAQVLEINRSELQAYYDVVQKSKNGEVLTDSEISFLRHGTIEMQISKYMKDEVKARLRGVLQDVKKYTNNKGINNGKPIDVATIDDYSKAAHDFAEGNKALETLLLTSHQQSIETIASCGGHIDITGENSPYVAFKITPTFSKYLPSILSALEGKDFDIGFQKNLSSDSSPSFVMFYARNYDSELFNTLNSIIGTTVSDSLVLSINMQKIQNIYDLISNLDIQMQFSVNNKIFGSTNELSYSIVSDFLTEKTSLTSEELTSRLSIIEEFLTTQSKFDKISPSSTDSEFVKLQDFFDSDLEIKKIISQNIIDDSYQFDQEYLSKYSDVLLEMLRDLKYYFKKMALVVKLSDSYIDDLFKNYELKLAECGLNFNKLKTFYNDYISDMSENIVNLTREKFVGYTFSEESFLSVLNEAKTINEILHIFHSFVTNNEDIYTHMPMIDKKENNYKYPITLYGENNDVAQSLFESFPNDLDVGWTEIVSLKNRILLMVRDRGHALTIEITYDNSGNAFVEYFIPKVCNVDMVNMLKGVRKVPNNSSYFAFTTGAFETTIENLNNDLYDFIGKVPTDSDIDENPNFDNFDNYDNSTIPNIPKANVENVSSSTLAIEDRLIAAINEGGEIDSIIDEIINLTDDALPQGYKNLAEFKERIIDKLIETQSLLKLNNKQFYDLIDDDLIILRKVIGHEKLTYFITSNLAKIPNKFTPLFENLTTDELIKIFDNDEIANYFASLTDKEFLEVVEAFTDYDSNVIVISSNFRNRLFKINPKILTTFLGRYCYKMQKIIKNANENGMKFIEEFLKIYGTDDIMINNPQLATNFSQCLPFTFDGEFNSYKEILKNFDKKSRQNLCNKLISNALIDIPEDGIIKKEGYFDIKYTIDGIEYVKKESYSFGKLDLLSVFISKYNEMMSGKLKIISITEDVIRKELELKDDTKDGLNVVTLEINGEIEKYVVRFRNGSTSELTKLIHQKQINSLKIVSVEPFIQPSFDLKVDSQYSAYKLTYTINNQQYEHYFPVNGDTIYLDSFITSNNLYNATNFKIEPFNLNDIPDNQFKINKYKNSGELFNNDTYGGDQSDVRKIVVSALAGDQLSEIDRQKSEILIKVIKNYYPDAQEIDLKNIAKAYEECGCGYMAVANSFITYMNSIENGASIFLEKMGFDMFVTDGTTMSLNVEAIALDFFLYTHKIVDKNSTIESLLKKSHGISGAIYPEITTSYFNSRNVKTECDVDMFSLDEYKKEIAINSLNNNGFWILGSSRFDLEILGDIKPIGDDKALSTATIKRKILKNIGGHAMLITDMFENGDLMVSSWNGKYRFIPNSHTSRISIYSIIFNIINGG